MKLRTTLIVLLAVCFAISAMAADKVPSRVGPKGIPGAPSTRDLFEGFEGAFPPAGWTLMSASGHSANENFYQGDALSGSPIEGLYNMVCEWDPDLIPQDNTISFDHTFVAGEDYLNFFISGSVTWMANYDLAVEVDGVPVYSWAATYAGPDWEDEFVNIDMMAYAGMTVTITFRYTGLDGAAIYIDAMSIDDGTGWEPPPPPPAPLNDTCEGAWDNDFAIMPGAFSYVGDNTLANADYPMDFGSCTGYSFSGFDLVWPVCMAQGDVLDVTMSANFDASFFLVTDCSDPFNSCVIGADDPETFVYTAAADGIYYLICGGYSSGIGPFTLDGVLTGEGCIVDTETKSWDGLKTLYR
jgi:hypothetical protein